MSHAFSDRDVPKVTWVPDIAGLYKFDLVVNDGELNSLPMETLVNVSEHKIPLGFVPDLSFMWRYLPDFWNMVEDREIVEVFWGGMAQAVTALMMTAWQLDYGKSLRDIPRMFQRRWVGYSTEYEEPDAYRKKQKIRITRGPITGTVNLAAGANVDGKTLLLAWDARPTKTVTFASVSQPSPAVTDQEVVDQINTQLGVNLSANKIAALTSGGMLQLSYGGLLEVGALSTASGDLLGAAASGVDVGNILTGTGQRDATNNRLFTLAAPADLTKVQSNDILSFRGAGYRVKRVIGSDSIELHDAMDSTVSGTWELASTVELFASDLTKEVVSPGDIAYFNVEHKKTGELRQVQCTILGAAKYSLGFDAAPLFWLTHGLFGNYAVWLGKIRRCRRIPTDVLVEKIPRLQETLLDPATIMRMYDQYDIAPRPEGRMIEFAEGTFSIDDPPPEMLWAVVTYLNNSPQIEASFGDAVGLRADAYAQATTNGDYLSAVQGLWYAFFHGPTLFNLKLGVQILLGLPFTEVAGTISEINGTYTAKYARVLIKDAADAAVQRSYLIPRAPVWESYGETPIAYRAGTTTDLAVGDAVPAFHPLSKGVEVEDYISDPLWWKPLWQQGRFLEIHKFFKFLVRADVDVFPIPNLVLASSFLSEIRPGYTLEKLFALKRLPPTEIDTADALTLAGVLHLFDDPACLSPGSYRWDDVDGSGNWTYQWDPLMGVVDIMGGANVNGLTLDMTVGAVTSTVTFTGANPISANVIADQICLEFGLPVAGLFVHDGKQYLTLQYDSGVTVAPTGTANALLGMYRQTVIGRHQVGYGGAAVDARTLDLIVAGTPGTITFTGPNPVPPASLLSQINAVFAGLATIHVHEGRSFLRLDDPLGVLIEGGTAAWELGLILGFSARSMHVWDRRSSKCPRTYLEAYMTSPMPQTVLNHPANMGPAIGTYFIPWDWIWAWDGSGGKDVEPLSGPAAAPGPPYGTPLDGGGAAAYPGTIQWDGKNAVVTPAVPGPAAVTYGAYTTGTYHRTKVL